MVGHSALRSLLKTALFLMPVLTLSGCDTWKQEADILKIDVLVEIFFLQDASQTTVEGSFRLCDTENPRALRWIQSLYSASSNQEVLHIYQNFQDSFNISKSSPSWEDFQAVHNKVKELATGSSNPNVVKRQAAFLLAGCLHRFYLRNANTLRQSLKYLEPLYLRTMQGDIPDCVSKGKSTWHPAVYPMRWVIGILGLIVLLVVMVVIQKKPINTNKKDIPIIKESPSILHMYKPLFHSEQQSTSLPSPKIDAQSNIKHNNPSASITNLLPQKKEAQSVTTPDPRTPSIQHEENVEQKPFSKSTFEAPLTKEKVPQPAPIPQTKTEIGENKVLLPKRFYARMPSGNTFYQLSDVFEPNETFFVLSTDLDDPKMASVSLTDDQDTLAYFLTHMLNHQSVCELSGSDKPTVENIRETELGTARKSGDYWEMKTSIKTEV